MALFALLAWPVMALPLFSLMGVARGLIWSILIGYLFLPEAFEINLPVLPAYEKSTAIALSALLGVFLFRSREPEPAPLPAAGAGFGKLLTLLFVLVLLSPIGTVIGNPETLVTGDVRRPGLDMEDLPGIFFKLAEFFVPFVLAYWYLSRPEHHRELLVAIVAMGLVYSLMTLFEARMSPQLHVWTYGYFQHDWLQHIRGGAFRPIGFVRHGLWLGFFLCMAAISALVLIRDKDKKNLFYLIAAGWILVVLVISRNLGATAIAICMIPLILLLRTRLQMQVAAGMAILFLSYPVLVAFDISPGDMVASWVSESAPARAQSLQFRLDNEHLLYDRAMEKPFFGWGPWSRSFVYTETGYNLTVVDGVWIVVLSQRGWVGFVAYFGILILPILVLALRSRKERPRPEIAGMALLMGANFIYIIPNSVINPIGLMVAGVLAGCARRVEQSAQDDTADTPTPSEPALTTAYTRFPQTDRPRRPERQAKPAMARSSRARVGARYRET